MLSSFFCVKITSNLKLRRCEKLNVPIILFIVGIITSIASFFFGKSSSKYVDELEKVSISLHQETNSLKKRLKNVEEELMISATPVMFNDSIQQSLKPKTKAVHEIIVNQILSLHSQGYSINEIANRASLAKSDVQTVLQSKGVIA